MNINNMRLVCIDDNPTNLLLVESYATSLGLKTESFLEAPRALEYLSENNHDIVITDYMMPHMDGVSFIEAYRKRFEHIPVVMLTAIGDDRALHVRALEAGATDFLTKPINAPAFKARIQNLLKLRKSQLLLEDRAKLLEDEVNQATRTIAQREHETLHLLGKAAEYKDPETGAHVERVSRYCALLARELGLDEETQRTLLHASPFHDIGKVGIPDAILLKPAKLDDGEFAIMKTHTTIGYEILKNAKSPYLKAGSIIAFTHHEKYDGSGYPKGLKGEMIPIMGRIVALADVFDALASPRPYKKAWSIDETFDFINSQKGKHFDPKIVECFLDKKEEILHIYNTHQDKE